MNIDATGSGARLGVTADWGVRGGRAAGAAARRSDALGRLRRGAQAQAYIKLYSHILVWALRL